MPKNNCQTEQELVTRCIQGDRIAQKQLFDTYNKAMFTKAYRIVNDYDQANDVLQEAFIEVFRDIRQFKGESSLGVWIKAIVVRKALKRQKIEIRFESIDESFLVETIVWEDNLTGEYLHQAIRSLPAGYRAVFTLIEIEGYTHKEVSHLLDISEGTSKSQLYHAKKLLQKLLKEIIK